jgi:hypothetical protein
VFTKGDYSAKQCSFEDYYGQFVDSLICNFVRDTIGINRLDDSRDIFFNDIPNHVWSDLIPLVKGMLAPKLKDCGDDVSNDTIICILKSAARRIKKEHR